MNASSKRRCVERLASSKSQQNIIGALNIYHENAELVTVGLGVRAHGRHEIQSQLEIFFTLFPDYSVELIQVACNSEALLAAGKVTLSPRIKRQSYPLISLPVSFSFLFKEEKIIREEFYLDFGLLCKKSGISPEQLMQAINDI